MFFWTGIPTVLGIIDGARLFTQVAEEDDLETDDQVTSISDETVEEVTKEAVDETEENDEDDEVEEKIKSLRKMNSRRKKKCQK